MSIISKDTFFKIFGSGVFNGHSSTYFTGIDDVEPLIAFSRTFYPKTVIVGLPVKVVNTGNVDWEIGEDDIKLVQFS